MCVGEQTGTQSHSALRIVAACQSTAEFVAAYSRYCEGRSLFIATKSPKPIGHIVKFKIALASGEHLMTGVGPVVETFDDRDNRFNRPGMRVEVEKLDASGREWMEQLRSKSSGAAVPGSAPRVAASPTGMFSTISDESAAMVAPPAPLAPPASRAAPPPPTPAAAAEPEKKQDAAPVSVADNLSAGWELDGLSDALAPLRKPRPPGKPAGKSGDKRVDKAAAAAPSAPADKPARKPAETVAEMVAEKPAETVAEKPADKVAKQPAEAIVASGELDVAEPLPPPPRNGRSKRITFPALMFNKSRGMATPPIGAAVVPKPLASAAAQGGKVRPPTAPLMTTSQMAALSPVATADREPAAPVAPLGTPPDTEPHATVPQEIESSLARALAPLVDSNAAEGTPPPAASADSSIPLVDDNHPDIADAPPEDSGEIHTGETKPDITPDKLRTRPKDSNTTPPPVWASRTVTQTFHAMVGGRPDPKVQEETIHWTNPGFAALARPPIPPHVDIIEEEMSVARSSAVPVEVGVEITADVMDRTVVSPPPVLATSRRPLIAAVAITAVAGLGIGYFLGLSRGTPLEKLPVGAVAAAGSPSASAERPSWAAECPDPAGGDTLAGAVPADDVAETAEVAESAPAPTAAARTRPPEARAAQPPAAVSTSSGGCYLNVMTSPVGATVLIDNKASGQTPLRTRISCGQHSVKLEMVNFQAATRTFTVRRGDTQKLSVELNRQRTVLRVESTPSGASVLVNGTSIGVTPLTTTVPGSANSTVTFIKPGFKTITKQITPSSGSARMSVTFKPEPTARRAPRR
jgi:hypothetical protein